MTGALKHGGEELPHVRGQGQKSGGPHARRAAAKRNYPTSEVRGSGRECQAATVQERLRTATQVQGQGWQLRGATLRLRSGAAAEWSYPVSEARGGGWKELPNTGGRGQWLGGATPRPRSGGCVGAGGPRGASPVEVQEGLW